MIVVSARTLVNQTGGNTTYLRSVMAELDALDVSVRSVAPAGNSGLSGVASQLRWAGFEATRLQSFAERNDSKAAWYPADTGPIRRRPGIKTVLTLHGVGALHEPTVRNRRSTQLWLARAKRAALASDRIVTVSDSSRVDIATLAGDACAAKVTVIPHGVAPFWFEPASVDTLTDSALPDRFAFFFGNLEPRKNLGLAIEAIDSLRAEHPELGLVVSGAPAWDSDSTLRAMAAHSWVTYLGRQSDEMVRALLARCEFLIFPSKYEGFGLPVLEAFATGAKVVCSTRGSLREVAGDVGFTFDELDVEAATDACSRAMKASKGATAAAGIAHARTFEWSKSGRAHADVFES